MYSAFAHSLELPANKHLLNEQAAYIQFALFLQPGITF